MATRKLTTRFLIPTRVEIYGGKGARNLAQAFMKFPRNSGRSKDWNSTVIIRMASRRPGT